MKAFPTGFLAMACVAGCVSSGPSAPPNASDYGASLKADDGYGCMGEYAPRADTDSVVPFDSARIQQESEIEEACPDEMETDVTAKYNDE